MGVQSLLMGLTIRPTRKEDWPAIARLLVQIAALHAELRPDVYRPARKYDQKQYNKLLKDREKPILVAVDARGEVLGYAMCQIVRRRGIPVLVERSYLYVDDLCVDENCRGQGIGELLMQAVTDLARELGLRKIQLSVNEHNEGARKFYERLGYTTQARQLEIDL